MSKEQDAKGAAGAKPETQPETQPELKIGDVARVSAVFGKMVNPTVPDMVFDHGDEKKVEIDGWVLYQIQHGKLKAEKV